MAQEIGKQLVIVGLGNPGAKYEMTRHNIGAIVVKGFARIHGMAFKDDPKYPASTAKQTLQSTTVHLVLPLTYMNESGTAVRKYLDYYKLHPENVLVISDDADLPFGALRLRSQGSSGGHNGLKSVERHLGTSKYARLKIGIGRNAHGPGTNLGDFVLDRFTKNQEDQLVKIIDSAGAALNQLLNDTLEDVMHVINVNVKSENQSPSPREGDK